MLIKKETWIVSITAILIIVLAGCGSLEGHEIQEGAKTPLSISNWPTPQPTAAIPTSTPFPDSVWLPTSTPPESDVDLEEEGMKLVGTPAPVRLADLVIEEEGDRSSGSERSSILDIATSGLDNLPAAGADTQALLQERLNQVILEELPPVSALGFVTVETLPVHQTPGGAVGHAANLQKGDVFGIIGKNTAEDWVFIVNAELAPGWVPVESLRITGDLGRVSVISPNALPNALASAQAAIMPSLPISVGGGSASSSSGTNVSPPPVLITEDMEAVTTAQINARSLNVRRGPSTDYQRLGAVSSGDKVTIYGTDEAQEWALIEAAGGLQGWVAVRYLTAQDSLAQAEVITPDPPLASQQQSTAEVAPVMRQVEAVAEESSSASGGISVPSHLGQVVATVRAGDDEVELRRAPQESAGYIDTMPVDRPLSLIALNESGEWAIIRHEDSSVMGWGLVEDLKIDELSILDNAPRVSFTGWIESNGIKVYRGPGIYYEGVGQVHLGNLVAVLGLSEDRSWVSMRPIMGGGQGWVSREFISLNESASEIPIISGPPIEDSSPPLFEGTPKMEGHLVFQLSSGGDIMIINTDGTGLRRLTHGIDPVLSPDGQTVAFTRWDEDDNGSLWTIDIDGSNERFIVGEMRKAKGPAWSADGTKIALNFQQGGRLEEDSTCFNLASGSPPRPARNARVSVSKRDGSVFICHILPPNPHWNLRVINVADGKFDTLDGGVYAFRPTWDPGQPWRIISDGGQGLVEVDVDKEKTERKLTENPNDSSPVFSPDGRFMILTHGKEGGSQDFNIHRLNGDGSGRVQLTETPLWVTTGPDRQLAWNNVAPVWSPDGLQIAFLTDRTGRWEIWLMSPDGSNQRSMFSEAINDQLPIEYHFVDERVLSWQ